MIDRTEYLLALKRLIFKSDSYADINTIIDYLHDRKASGYDKATTFDSVSKIQGGRETLKELKKCLDTTPEELDVEIRKLRK